MLKIKFLFGFLLIAASSFAQTPAITTEHGYRFYHHIKTGGQKPKRGETIKAYVNIFIGDTLLSSSRKNLGGTYKFDIAPEDAVLEHYPPLMDAALLMGIGDSATIFQPLDTAMRRFVPKAVQNQKELRFEIALVQVINADDKAKAEQAASLRAASLKTMAASKVQEYSAGNLQEQLTTTKSGLKVLLLERGRGKRVLVNDAVQVHYLGFLKNGTCFDNSFERHHPLAFPVGVGQMIPGFDEGVMLLPRGSKAYLFIPSALAYGDAVAADGQIPANSELIFYIEIL
jgi:FKBP-type peptidyl-prolyl cis-trans isomerase